MMERKLLMIIVLLTMIIMVNSGITIAYIFYILTPKSIAYRKDVIPEGKCCFRTKKDKICMQIMR